MKNAILVSLLCAASLNAQITIEKVYPAPSDYASLTVINLSKSGSKYVINEGNVVKLYSTNHSLWKTLVAPLPQGYTSGSIGHITEALFDNDDSDIEFVATFYNFQAGMAEVKVLDETANELFSISPSMGASIAKVGNDYKMIIHVDSMGKLGKRSNINVYSLVGSLPVAPPTGTVTGEFEDMTVKAPALGDPVPNPSAEQVLIPYSLAEGELQAQLIVCDVHGKVVRQYTVDRTFNNLMLDNRELAAGTYFYYLAGHENEGKKMVVVK